MEDLIETMNQTMREQSQKQEVRDMNDKVKDVIRRIGCVLGVLTEEEEDIIEKIKEIKNRNPVSGDWDDWSRKVYTFITGNVFLGEEVNDIKNVIAEFILSTKSNRKLIKKLENMRLQKKLLNTIPKVKYDESKQNITTLRSLMLSAVFIGRIQLK